MAQVNTLGPDYLDDATLDRMVRSAYAEAARSFRQYRREPIGSPIRPMLLASADSATDFWRTLGAERARRANAS